MVTSNTGQVSHAMDTGAPPYGGVCILVHPNMLFHMCMIHDTSTIL